MGKSLFRCVGLTLILLGGIVVYDKDTPRTHAWWFENSATRLHYVGKYEAKAPHTVQVWAVVDDTRPLLVPKDEMARVVGFYYRDKTKMETQLLASLQKFSNLHKQVEKVYTVKDLRP